MTIPANVKRLATVLIKDIVIFKISAHREWMMFLVGQGMADINRVSSHGKRASIVARNYRTAEIGPTAAAKRLSV